MQKEETTRDKWAQILLRMKGNIPEIRIRQSKYPQQGQEEIHTRASDRKKEKQTTTRNTRKTGTTRKTRRRNKEEGQKR